MTYRSGFMDARVIGRAEGEARGRAEEKSAFVEMMLRAKEPVSKIRQYTQLSLEQIQEIAKSIGVSVVM